MPKTFYLIDGHSQIFRAYYAPFQPLTAPSGEPVKATFIFTQMILAILRDHRPDYIAVAMDVDDSTTRRAREYPEYKQNREATPEDLPPQIERIREIVGVLGIPVYLLSGYEADDLIASIAERLSGEDVELRIVSRDKDLYQIITDRVKLWDPVKVEIIDSEYLQKNLGFTPAQAVEVQTLTGDSIDNVPGIPGIGPKTAAALIKRYGTADQVLAHVDELKGKQRENLIAHAHRIPLARKLVTLCRDVPLDFRLEDCRVKPVPVARLRPIIETLRLRRLSEQLEAMAGSPVVSGAPDSDPAAGAGWVLPAAAAADGARASGVGPGRTHELEATDSHAPASTAAEPGTPASSASEPPLGTSSPEQPSRARSRAVQPNLAQPSTVECRAVESAPDASGTVDSVAAKPGSAEPSRTSAAASEPTSEVDAAVEGGPGGQATVADPRLGELFRLSVTPPGYYTLIDTQEAFEDFLASLSKAPMFAVDTETTSLHCVDCQLVGLSFSWRAGEGFYLPVRSRWGRVLETKPTLARLKPILEDPSVKKCGQNLKFDIQVLRTEGIELKGVVFDSMIASYLLRPEERGHDLDTLSREFLGHLKIPTRDLLGKGRDQVTMLDVETRRVADYAAEDADMAWRLYEKLWPQIDASPMRSLFHDVEVPLIRVLADMEYEGIRIDCDHLRSLSAKLGARIGELCEQIFATAGREFLIDSPKQLAAILFDEHKLRVVRTTKTSRSTDAEVLETLAIETADPLPRLVLEYRELSKLRGTYVDPLPKLISPTTGRLHASFHQTVAATGRLSSSDPNIQNIPIRSAEGREIRKAFVPRSPDQVLITADYSQIELRILAHLSRDPALVEAFQEDRDIHAFVAAQIAGVPEGQVTREQRSRAKAVNFGIIYGQGAFGLARQLSIPQKEAAEFINIYKKRYPGIVSFMAECVAQAERTGKVTTLLGRQRAIPEIVSRNRARRSLGERLAINTVIQGTAADMIKVAMVRVHTRIEREALPAKLLIQVHDELVLETPRDSARETAEMVREEMMSALPLTVPLKVDIAWGDNWLEAGGDN